MAWQTKVLTAESDALSPMHPRVPHGRLRELTPYRHMHTGICSLPTNRCYTSNRTHAYLVLYTVSFNEPYKSHSPLTTNKIHPHKTSMQLTLQLMIPNAGLNNVLKKNHIQTPRTNRAHYIYPQNLDCWSLANPCWGLSDTESSSSAPYSGPQCHVWVTELQCQLWLLSWEAEHKLQLPAANVGIERKGSCVVAKYFPTISPTMTVCFVEILSDSIVQT